MDKNELKKKLADEGFLHIYEWKDEPATEYPLHAHKDKVSIYILEGNVTFWFDEEEVLVVTGECFEVPVGKEHVAKVGPEGCTYLVGEMVEGDS